MKKVLIAHQSSIPHYRVPFYNALERVRSEEWTFDVVFDPTEFETPIFFKEPLDQIDFAFSLLETRTLSTQVSGKGIHYQTFWKQAGRYDLIIVENAVNNLTYPLCHFHQLHGKKIAFWGHGKDFNVANPGAMKRASEHVKMWQTRRADGFFAYTPGIKEYLVKRGVDPNRVFVVNNTIDIEEQRTYFDKYRSQREEIRKRLGIGSGPVLLFVGRFTKNKRIDFLLEAFSYLQRAEPQSHLLLVGGGDFSVEQYETKNVHCLGTIVDLDELAPIYAASDLFAFPGAIGLAPLQALCYDLPVITLESTMHKPEVEYLTSANSIILPSNLSPKEYASELLNLTTDGGRLRDLRSQIWPSIRHLTIEQMAKNFASGVTSICF
ncbi:MAG: glycosyltransferase family 4 protein [Chloroflexota bacterium]